MPASPRLTCVSVAVFALGAALAMSVGSGAAATAGSTVGATVLSSSTLSTTGCPTPDPTRTSFGSVTAGSSSVTSADCDVLFGSSNDTATLRAYQSDGRGAALEADGTSLTGSGSGNRMLDVDMATSLVGWAVGEGTANQRLYKTTDGGVTWTALLDANDGLNGSAEGVDAVSTTVAWASRSNSNEVARTTDGTNWTSITLTAFPTAQINRIVAADANTAWALGAESVASHSRARIWMTTDGGSTWSLVWSDNTLDSEAHEGSVLSPTDLWVATSAWSTGNGILHSTNGTTFSGYGGAGSFYDVDAYDANHVAAASSSGTVSITSNGGTSWNSIVPPVDQSFRAIDYDSSGAITVGSLGGWLLRSPDDGTTWNVLDQDRTGGRYYAIDAVGSEIVASLYGSTIVRSADAGVTWSINAQSSPTNWEAVDGVDGGRLWRVGGMGTIQTSTDGGATWAAQTSGTTNHLIDVVAVSRTRAVVVGSHGTVLRTSDGGTTWTTVAPPTTVPLRTVTAAPDPWGSTLYVGGDGGLLLRSTDDGATWSTVATPTTAPIGAIGAWTDRSIIVTSMGGSSPRMWTSADAGATWTARAPGTSDGVVQIDVIPGTSTAFTVDNATVRRTTDGGATWSSSTPTNTNLLAVDAFGDGTNVWTAGEYGNAYRSTDSGATWTAWTGGSTSHLAMDLVALGPDAVVTVNDGNYSKVTTESSPIPDYDGAAASWTGTGFFGMCLRAAPSTTATWPTTGSCPASNGTNWRGVPASGGIAAAPVASTSALGTTTVSFRFGLKVPSAQMASSYHATITFEVLAPAG